MRNLAIASVLVVAACAGGVPVDHQVVVPGGQFAAVQGEAALVVRTFLDDRSEVIGANCDVVSSLFTAQIVTPSRLVVPNFGAQSPELTATCRADKLAGSATVGIVTRWQQPPWGYPGAGPWGPWGPWGGWGWSGYGAGFPVSDYPNLIVTLR